jgi:antitoxin (DNA-binding transcriptional repressor) of toxin-antitoxin stability system
VVYLVIIYDYIGHMKVKVADLKANLSRHLRYVRETGDKLDICMRENTVAYLTPAQGDRSAGERDIEVKQRLAGVGVEIVGGHVKDGPLPVIQSSIAGDGQIDISTVSAMRGERNW